MRKILIFALTFLALSANANFKERFSQKVKYETNIESSMIRNFDLTHRESELRFEANKNDHQFYDIKVSNKNEVLLTDDGPYAYVTMSTLGNSILLVKIDVESSSKKVIVFAKNKKREMLFEYPANIALDEFDPNIEYTVSDDGKSFMMLRIKEGEGIANVEVCNVIRKVPKCSSLNVQQDYFLSGTALLNKNKVIILSSKVQVDGSEEQKQYSLSSMIQMFEGENLVWQHSLGNSTDYKWESAEISPYKKEFVVYNHNNIEVRDIKTGDLVWKLNKGEIDHKIKSMFDIYLDRGHIIIPFADESGFYRRKLSEEDE